MGGITQQFKELLSLKAESPKFPGPGTSVSLREGPGPPRPEKPTVDRGRPPYRGNQWQGRSRSPSPVRSSSPRPDERCYGCNELGHYKADCPHRNRGSSPSRVSENSQGLGRVAEAQPH